jgi:hypothetical protein
MVAGILLLIYVTLAIIVQDLGMKSVLDSDTVKAVMSTVDLPTILVLVIYAGLTIRQEVSKPKHNLLQKSRRWIDGGIILGGIVLVGTVLYIKYLM